MKGILREYDRGAYGEAFRGDRLAKIAVLGKGELRSLLCRVIELHSPLAIYLELVWGHFAGLALHSRFVVKILDFVVKYNSLFSAVVTGLF